MTPDQLRVVPLADITIKADRRHDTRLDPDLVASIRQHGLLQPLVVLPDGAGRYEVLAGRRRLRHARAAGLQEVPVLIRGAADRLGRLMIEAEENAHRRDWTPIEVADLCYELTHTHDWTQAQVADWLSGLLGRSVSQPQVSQYVKLRQMTPDAQQAVATGAVSFACARQLSRLNGIPDLQRQLVAEILRELEAGTELTSRALRKRVERLLTPAEIHLEERQTETAGMVARLYEVSAAGPSNAAADVRTQDPDRRDEEEVQQRMAPDCGPGDPLVAVYLDVVREGLDYLVRAGAEISVDGIEEVIALAEQLKERAQSE